MIKVEEKNLVATVWLDRPDVRNAFHPEMIQKITETFQKLSGREDLKAIVLRGEGKSFCAGADLGWMQEMVKYSLDENQKDSLKLFAMFDSIYHCRVPVIGVVHGAAFGGALGLIAACDYVLAEETTQLCFSEVKLGIAPAVISAFVLKKVSLGVVGPLMLTGQVFTPKDVSGSGLIHQAVPAGKLGEALQSVLTMFSEVGPEAVRETKKLIQNLNHPSWDEAKSLTTQVIAERRVSREGQEGLKSFLEKRTPAWKKGSHV